MGARYYAQWKTRLVSFRMLTRRLHRHVELEKVQAISYDIEYVGRPDKQNPWIIHDYSEPVVQRTVKTFNDLVQSIESRLPTSATVSPDEAGSSFLADEATLSAAGIFVGEFLSRVRSPQFKYIAPGISVQISIQLKDQPYRAMPTEDDDINAILLFRGDRIVTNLGGIFYPPSKDITEYPSGLLSPAMWTTLGKHI